MGKDNAQPTSFKEPMNEWMKDRKLSGTTEWMKDRKL